MRDSKVEGGGWRKEDGGGEWESELPESGMTPSLSLSYSLFLSLTLLTYLASRPLPTYIHFCPNAASSAHPTPRWR